MIMDLPKDYIGNGNDIYVQNKILKLKKSVSFRKLVYKLAYKINGSKHKCFYCGCKINTNKATLDHIYPQDMGGPTITNNLLPSCLKCNNEKSNLTLKEYKKLIKSKKNGSSRQYFIDLQKKKEGLRLLNEYQLPNKWISEHEISSIIVLIKLDGSEDTHKYKKVSDFYETYGYFQKPIVIDRNGFLLDGFYNVYYAKKHNITSLKTIKLQNVEVVF